MNRIDSVPVPVWDDSWLRVTTADGTFPPVSTSDAGSYIWDDIEDMLTKEKECVPRARIRGG